LLANGLDVLFIYLIVGILFRLLSLAIRHVSRFVVTHNFMWFMIYLSLKT